MNFYALLETAINSNEIDLKEKYTAKCLVHCTQNSVEYNESFTPELFKEPSYSSFCKIVDPRELPSRKDFDTTEGLATLVHAIAHIEYSAIDLALDAVYRYPQMPIEYKIDWLEVADDEIRHFKMLHELLQDLGYDYGDFPVHSGLFDASRHTAGDILDRMAVIPRYYEASGLDVNPQIVKKLENRRKIPNINRLINMLNIIYDEEIVHVHKGDKWFRYLCELRKLDVEPTYMEILKSYLLIDKHRPHLNVEARKEAGFSCHELLRLGAKVCK
ncbi:MAG: ferritin-like domain-containing protein [Campylobacterota bacterium]|nr:ferritin-like domain-containing protein [Campylobacterota bacterium]